MSKPGYHPDMGLGSEGPSIYVSVSIQAQMFSYLASIGLDPETLREPEARIPMELYVRIEEAAGKFQDLPYFAFSPALKPVRPRSIVG